MFAHLPPSRILILIAEMGLDTVGERKDMVGWLRRGDLKFPFERHMNYKLDEEWRSNGPVGNSYGSFEFSRE